METHRRRVSERRPKSLKWWWKNNRFYIFIILAIGFAMAFALNYEIKYFEFRRMPNIILNKEHREILQKQGGLNDEDVEKLRRFYPDVNWEQHNARKRYLKKKTLEKE